MEEIILQQVTYEEMIAPEGKYLTQSADIPDNQRLYFTRRPLLNGESVSNWRIAELEEKQDWELKQTTISPNKFE